MKSEEHLSLPGPWIEHTDRDFAFLTRMILDSILNQLDEAHLVLNLFEEQDASNLNPESRDQRLRHLYAKSFVYALDTAIQLVRVLNQQDQLSPTAHEQAKKILGQFGKFRELRNSLHHVEDRLRGIGRKGEPIPSSLLILGSFRNYKFFGATTEGGNYVEMEISNRTLLEFQSMLEDWIWCFDWLGPGNIKVIRERPGA